MKKLFVTSLASLLLASASSAFHLDTETLGQALNGWRKNRTASYTIDNHSYRTHKPTVTPTPGGGAFVSTRVEHKPRVGVVTTSYIELTFSRGGTLLTGQLRVVVKGKQITTGMISRPGEAPPVAEGEAPAHNPTPWKTQTTQLVNDMFRALDTEFSKLAKSDVAGKRDIFSRVFAKDYGSADLAAALRHNLNLILRYSD